MNNHDWIDATKQLPPHNTSVLAWGRIKGSSNRNEVCSIAYHLPDEGWLYTGAWPAIVTHWMFLPSGPAGAKENNTDQDKLPKYECNKEVRAVKIRTIERDEESDGAIIYPEEEYGPIHVTKTFMYRNNPAIGGYYVVYKDNHRAYVPAEVFEQGYVRIPSSSGSCETANYQNKYGKTTADDPERRIWVSVNCTYWTDNWDRVDCHGVPACPFCESPGLEYKAKDWFESIDAHNRKHRGYKDIVMELKEKCDDLSKLP